MCRKAGNVRRPPSSADKLTNINSSVETTPKLSGIDSGVEASNQQAEALPGIDARRLFVEEQDPNENLSNNNGNSTTNQGDDSKSNSTDLPLESRQVSLGNPYSRFEIEGEGK